MKLFLDVDYMAYAILAGVFGVVGITVTANVHPNILASATCNCIPAPAARLQELSVILLAFGLVLAPIGMLRKTTITPMSSRAQLVTGSGREYTAPPMRSGGLLALGVSLVVLGVSLVALPAFLVLGDWLLVGEGAAVFVLGLFLAYLGSRRA